jgi:hypothetical protein
MSDLTWLTLVIIFFGCIIVWQLAMLMDRLGYMVGLLGDIKNAARAPAQPIDDRVNDQQRPEQPMHMSAEERQQDQIQ